MLQRSAARILFRQTVGRHSFRPVTAVIYTANSSASGLRLKQFHTVAASFQQQPVTENATTTEAATATTTQQTQTQGKPNVTIFGGSGFVGRHVVEELAPHCSHITVACRYPGEYNALIQKELAANPDSPLRVVTAVEANVTDSARVEQLVASADVVVNLVGIQYESDNSFAETFVDGTRNVFYAANRMGTKHAVHLGILGAEIDHDSRWLDMAFRADDMSYASYPDVTILRSSLIFGKGARLFERTRTVGRLIPFMPLPFTAQGSFQPIHVSDVAKAVAKCVLSPDETRGNVYELAGPNVYSFRELIRATTGRGMNLPVVRAFWDLIFGVTQFLPRPTFTRDHIPVMDAQMVYTDDPETKTLKDLGIEPKSMEEAWK